MIFDTLFLQFQTDASKTQAEVAALEKQIESLKQKGKARSEQENKDLKDSIARRKELGQTLKDQQRDTDKLRDSIVDATAALVGFAAVRNGITSASKFNSDLKVQSDLLNQNAHDLDVYSEAAKAAGGSVEGFMGNISAWQGALTSAGIKPGNFKDWFKAVQQDLAKYSGDEKRTRLSQYEFITDPGLKRMLLNPQEFDKRVAQSEKDSSARQEDFEHARKTQELLSSMDKNIQGIWNVINRYLPDSVSAGLQGAGGTALEAVGGWAIFKKLLSRGGGAAAGGGAVASAARGGIVAAGALATAGIADFAINGKDSTLTKMGNSFWNGYNDLFGIKKAVPAAQGYSDVGFWMGKGYSREQAAAITGNMMAESGGNASARGDGGRAHGLFQWHPDRRARILAGTNIDVSTADRKQQMEAAAWEMKNGVNGFKDSDFRATKDHASATRYFGSRFEGFAGSDNHYGAEMMRRVTMASNAFGGGGGGKSVNVTVGNVTITSQATDSKGIAQDFAGHLSSVMKQVAAENDDGVKY